MQTITGSWISYNTGCRTLEALFSSAAKNVPAEYARRPWSCPGLDHGRAILTNDAQLNCYVHAYGLMHVYKIWKALEHLPLDDMHDGFEIIDWGCGQGIATLTLLAWLRNHCPHAAAPRHVTLLDASDTALYRAWCLVKSSLRGSDAAIDAVLTDLSSATCPEKASRRSSRVVIHLFSNIIDVPGINIRAMAEAVSGSQCRSYVVCAGHHATEQHATKFSRLPDMRNAHLLHRENIRYGAVLNNGKRFGWDITVLQRDSMAMAA